jgi:hypothetical protein
MARLFGGLETRLKIDAAVLLEKEGVKEGVWGISWERTLQFVNIGFYASIIV